MAASSSWRSILLLLALALTSACGTDICSPGTPPAAGDISSPGFPALYDVDIDCTVNLVAQPGSRLRLRFDTVDLPDLNDTLMIVDQDGIMTWVTGTSIPKDFIGSSFDITFMTDEIDINGTGFMMLYEEYTRDPITTRVFMQDIDLKPSKSLHLYTNDYPMLYDDNTYYMWNITSSTTDQIVITVVDLDTEAQRDWLVVTSHSSSGSEVLLAESGTPADSVDQIQVLDSDYVTIEFISDYSRHGRGFHIIVEPDSALADMTMPTAPSAGCGGELTIYSDDLELSIPADSSDLVCVWTITANQTGSRLQVHVAAMSVEEGVDYFQISTGLEPTDWKSYRRRWTGDVSDEYIYIDEGGALSLVFASGNSSNSRTFLAHVGYVKDYGCGGMLDLATTPFQEIEIGNVPADTTSIYCQWLVKTTPHTNVNAKIIEMKTGSNYDLLEIGYGSDPSVVGTRQKLFTGDVSDETFSTYYGDLWVVFSSEDMVSVDTSIMLSFDDNACQIKTILEQSGEIDSPLLGNGLYPQDSDCQWIVQVRGGYQIRLHFLEFDLEYGHDQLIIGGANPDEDSVDSSYLVLTGSEVPEDVVSRFNGLNIRFKTDSIMAKSGFKLTFQEFFDCPDGYEYNPTNETCYKFVTTPASWLEARYDCNDVADGDLVVIEDSDENDYVLEKIQAMQMGNDSWVGFYDLAINDQWRWVDCEASALFGNFNWRLGSPDGDDEHCASMSSDNGRYDDSLCTSSKSYVCEITRKNYVDSDCYPSDFRVLSSTKTAVDLTFTVSSLLCDVAGYKIRHNTSDDSVFVEYELTGATTNDLLVPGLEQNTTYLFELTTCTVSYGCYGYSTARSVLATTEVCPEDYPLLYDDGCYGIFEDSLSWVDARSACLYGGVDDADLVNIETEEENAFLRDSIAGSENYWIGLYDVIEEGEFFWGLECVLPPYRGWNGGNHPKNDDLDCATIDSAGLWSDANCTATKGYICEQRDRGFRSEPDDLLPSLFRGTAVDEETIELTWTPADRTCDIFGYVVTVAAGDTEPMKFIIGGGETSLLFVMNLTLGTTYTCTITPSTFSFGESLGSATTTVQTLGCPPAFEASLEGVCYRVFDTAQTWSEARANCRSTEGADLVSVYNPTEYDHLRGLLTEPAWIGLRDTNVEGTFSWTDCSQATGDPWSTPANNTEEKDCVVVDGDEVVAVDCMDSYGFVCEVLIDFDPYPSNFNASPISYSEVQLSWSTSRDACEVMGYRIQYYTNLIRTELQVDGADATSVTVINLRDDTQYFFTISPMVADGTYPQSDPISATTLEAPPCPDGYAQGYDDICFRFSATPRTWVDARADCLQDENADLVEIFDDLKSSYLENETGDDSYWIGLYDAANEDDWRWSSECSAATYFKWAPGEPGDITGPEQDCVSFSGSSGLWTDQECVLTLPYICEIVDRAVEPDAIGPSTIRATSPTPNSVTLTWNPSPRQCDILAYVVGWLSMTGESGQQTVSGGETSRTAIIGLTPDTTYSFFVDTLTTSFGNLGNSAGVVVTTASACPVDYVIGDRGQCYSFVRSLVNFDRARDNCQLVEGSDLAVISTPQEHEYIMNMTVEGDWWVGLYDFATEGNFRWVDCSNMNVWQTSNWAPGQPDDTDGSEDCGQMISSGQWVDWPCNRPNMYICEIDPLAFLPRDPSPTDFAASALSIVSIGLTWMPSDFNCDVTGYRIFISQGLASTTIDVAGADSNSYIATDLRINTEYGFRIAALTQDGPLPYSDLVTESTNNETAGCPGEYEEGYNGRCYRFVKGSLTWAQARLECSKDIGGELVVVDDQFEHEFIVNRTIEGDWWIGLNDISTEGRFRWTDCTDMTLWQRSNWAAGEPDMPGDDQDCVQMITGGQWMDWPCQRPNQFICEVLAKDYVPLQTAPANFTATPASDSSVRLTWVPSQYNCDVYAYQIKYTDLRSEVEFVIAGGDADTALVSDLRAMTSYRFSIRPLLNIDRVLDYGIAIEATTLPYPGCQEPTFITSAPGNISSPYFPGTYPPNLDCRYIITLETRIQLAFQLLFILPDSDDYVRISEMAEGGEYEEKLKLTGVRLPKSYISTTTSVQVEFVTDSNVEAIGFLLTYTALSVVEPPSEKSCANVFPLKFGPAPLMFDSPGYPNGYESFQDCSWVFQAAAGDAAISADDLIELAFSDFSVESDYDVLVVGSGSDPSDPATELGRYSGNTFPGFVSVESDAVWLSLETDSSNSGAVRGFSLAASRKDSADIPASKAPPPVDIPVWNGTCGGELAVPVDGFQHVDSPGYPGDYPDNVDCTWYLLSEDRRIRLSINFFMTESGYDILEIGGGPDASDPSSLYVSLSGAAEPFSLMTEEAVGWIRFRSDYSTMDQGFSIYAQQDRDCEETLLITPVSRTISSPNYPLPYGSDEYCLWTVVSSSAQPIRAVVTNFMTEAQYDMVDVGSGRGENAVDVESRVTQLSGFVNESFTTNSLTMWLAFTSDGGNNMGGFEIAFFDDMCSRAVLTDLSGTISSPGYGFQYPNYASCNWAIQVGEGYNIRLTFQGSFDLETGRDTLSIVGSRAVPAGSLVLTGSDLPDDVISAGNNLIIQFSADSSVVGTGFSFTYEQFYDCPEGYVEADVNGPTCYKFGAATTWQEARSDCRSTPGADLIIIENALENRYIRDNSGGEQWWIGFYDGGQEGIFSFVECDTSTMGWAIYNWADDQPSRVPGNLEDCVYIDGSDGYYFDERCDVAKKYVCETLKVPDVIPDAFSPTAFKAEAVSSDTIRTTWSPSSYNCDVTGYILSVDENGTPMDVFVQGAGTSTYDLSGLSPDTKYTVSIRASAFSFDSLDSLSPIDATTLPEGVINCPANYIQGPDFSCWRFGIMPQTWYDARVACQGDDPDSDLAVIDTRVELDFVNSSRQLSTTYWIGLNDLGNERVFRWPDCQALDIWQSANWAEGQPQDPRGNNDCVGLTVAGEWDDLNCDATSPYVCKVQAKGFTEEDQYPSQFTVQVTSALTASAQWLPSLASCNLLGYYLVASDGGISDDVIVDVVGAISLRGEITGLKPDTIYVVSIIPYTAQGVLERRGNILITTFNESTICPEGYELGYDYGCYRFVTQPMSWDSARMDCMTTMDGDLAIVDTEDEMKYFIEHGFSDLDWWIGLYDQAQEGSYRWVDCSDLSMWGMSQWDIGQPSDVDGSENCGQLHDNAKFNDRACERTLPYVCEISPKDFTADDADPSLFIGVSPLPDSIILSWRPSDYNCDIIGYTVTYLNDGVQIIEVPGGDSNRLAIGGLMAETQYTFTLRAFTLMGPRNTTRTATVSTQPPENPCEEGWFPGHEDHCYKVAKSLQTWDDARSDCMSVEGGDLVVIETAEENEYLVNYTTGNDYWIGFYDRAREGTWTWVDCPADTEYAFSNWAAGQPNDLNGVQDCGQIVNSGQYNDWECDRTMMYICEVWPKGYVPSQANPSLFRGGADDPNTITLRWLPSASYSCDVTAYRITYQDPRDFLPTSIDVPGAAASTVTIGDLQDGATYNFTISSVLAAGPVLAAEETIVETPSLDDLCEPGWLPGFNYVCYKFVTDLLTWDEARADCKAVADGDLVIMETEEEHDFLRNLVPEGDWWIGFYDRGTEGSWKWVDCEAPALWARNNWAVGQPNDLSGSQDCGQMLNAGTWNDWECDRTGQYICEVTPKDWDVMDQNPTRLRGEALGPNDIELQWRPSAANCEVTGYRVYVVIQPDEDAYSFDVEGGEADSYLLKNLLANTVYDFDISAITPGFILPPVGPVTIDTPASGVCGNTEFLLESGFIISPGYPEPYSNNQDCLFTISLPDVTTVIEINVETLDLESGQDFLIIGSGEAVDENVIATLTGSEGPASPIITTSHQAWLRFFSDESTVAAGFSLSYQALAVEQDGEMIGSVTIVLVDVSPETLNQEDYVIFAQSIADQLNTYCFQNQENCEADMNGEGFTADNVHITSVMEVEQGIEVTFWVSDPNDATGNDAALTAEQLEVFLVDYEAPIEEGNGPNFDYVIKPQNVSPLDEAWVIAVIALLAFCFAVLVLVLIRDCCFRSKEDKKAGSLDSVEMVTADPPKVNNQNNNASRTESQYTDNVYFQPAAAIVADETKRAPPSTDTPQPQPHGDATAVATTSFSTPSTLPDALYAAPHKTTVQTTQATVEAATAASED